MTYESIILKLRINLCYILEMPIKNLKRAIATTSLTNGSVRDVSDHVVNFDVDHEEIVNTHGKD